MIIQISVSKEAPVTSAFTTHFVKARWMVEHISPTAIHCCHYAEVLTLTPREGGYYWIASCELLAREEYSR